MVGLTNVPGFWSVKGFRLTVLMLIVTIFEVFKGRLQLYEWKRSAKFF